MSSSSITSETISEISIADKINSTTTDEEKIKILSSSLTEMKNLIKQLEISANTVTATIPTETYCSDIPELELIPTGDEIMPALNQIPSEDDIMPALSQIPSEDDVPELVDQIEFNPIIYYNPALSMEKFKSFQVELEPPTCVKVYLKLKITSRPRREKANVLFPLNLFEKNNVEEIHDKKQLLEIIYDSPIDRIQFKHLSLEDLEKIYTLKPLKNIASERIEKLRKFVNSVFNMSNAESIDDDPLILVKNSPDFISKRYNYNASSDKSDSYECLIENLKSTMQNPDYCIKMTIK